jgi:hypothetical protein
VKGKVLCRCVEIGRKGRKHLAPYICREAQEEKKPAGKCDRVTGKEENTQYA